MKNEALSNSKGAPLKISGFTLAAPEGIEPPTPSLGRRRSIH